MLTTKVYYNIKAFLEENIAIVRNKLKDEVLICSKSNLVVIVFTIENNICAMFNFIKLFIVKSNTMILCRQ